ncbi:MAG TPA: cytochrome c peroxidase [Gammaproteobacteria bacterium]|nr:cytochrome c peroxidase [Gammaproteobacteria bacterium]
MRIASFASSAVLALAAATAGAYEWQPLPEAAPEPADNPTTEEKVTLGRMLYFDPRLSSESTISCFSCHNILEGGDDNRPVSPGVHGQMGTRNAPTVWNSAFLSVQFWDGRAPTLEEQAKGPITNPIEMGMSTHDDAVARVQEIESYQAYFDDAFGDGAAVNLDNIVKAIAAYERTLITPDSAYDRWAKGEQDALTEQQQRGAETFVEVGCVTCHSGPMFNGPQLPIGQGFYMKFPTFTDSPYVAQYGFMEDPGRYEATGNEADRHMWRVPTLRNIAVTGPYFHNGSVADLGAAVRVMAATQLNRELTDAQVADIVAFLNGLTGPFGDKEIPDLPESPLAQE